MVVIRKVTCVDFFHQVSQALRGFSSVKKILKVTSMFKAWTCLFQSRGVGRGILLFFQCPGPNVGVLNAGGCVSTTSGGRENLRIICGHINMKLSE